MSLVTSRLALEHRCTIERYAVAGDDGWGHPGASDWQPHLTDVPCCAWTDAGRELVDADRTAVIVDARLIVQLDTDVTERDRVTDITHRGRPHLDGPLGIAAVIRRGDHLELVLEQVRG